MTDQEKSILLAKARGWEIVEHETLEQIDAPSPYEQIVKWKSIKRPPEFGLTGCPICKSALVDLYDPANFPLAWQILNWAVEHESLFFAEGQSSIEWIVYISGVFHMPLADAARTWLDMIVELIVEAEEVEVPK